MASGSLRSLQRVFEPDFVNAENAFRRARSIAEIGRGWASETSLVDLVRSIYPDAIHQWRPYFQLVGPLPEDRPHPIHGGVEAAGTSNLYRLEPRPELAEYAGRLWIDWGKGYRAWIHSEEIEFRSPSSS